MAELKISRRTLQRWIDDMNIEPMCFEDHLKVFLTLPQYERLQEYHSVMKTRNMELIRRYRLAVDTDNTHLLARVRKKLQEFGPK